MLPSKSNMRKAKGKIEEVCLVHPANIKMDFFVEPRSNFLEEECRKLIMEQLADGFEKEPFTLYLYTGDEPVYLRSSVQTNEPCTQKDMAIFMAEQICLEGWNVIDKWFL